MTTDDPAREPGPEAGDTGTAEPSQAPPEAAHPTGGAGDPDVGFALDVTTDAPAADPAADPVSADPATRAKDLSHELARRLGAVAPRGWRRLESMFALTTVTEAAQVLFSDDQGRGMRMQPPEDVLELVREHRRISAQLSDGPWWRLLLTLSNTGELEVDHDYGDDPFPDDQLFPPEAYRADLEAYPRDRVPVWLAAYVGHGDRQARTPPEAARAARADRAAGTHARVLAEHQLPSFTVLWSRWAVIAAAFVAAGSQWGPRILPALGWFEGAKRSGSTLYSLPGGRAVLSGGVWNAPELDAAYNAGEPLPALYSGAPEWVADPVLNPRAANGLLSFCYWWENGRWQCGQSPAVDRISAAVPGIWTADTVADVVTGLVAAEPSAEQRAAVVDLVAAAEIGFVTREALVAVFGDTDEVDIDGAFYQLSMAGVALALPEPMAQQEAIARVRQFIEERGMDTGGYPLDELRADRIDVGWMVYVPAAPGELSIGRAIFYLADDGVLEQSSSSVAPSRFLEEFTRRFHERHGSTPV